VLGNSIQNKGAGVFEIAGERYNFSTGDSIHALARIFNITNVGTFKFRFEVLRNGVYYKEWQSQEYRPGGAWWAETYSWHNFGQMAIGSYQIRTYISLNGQSWVHRDTKNFSVGGPSYNAPAYYNPNYVAPVNQPYNYYYNPSPSYNPPYSPGNYNPNPGYYYGYTYHEPVYSHGYTKLGTDVRNTHSWYYQIVNERNLYDTNENIYVLTQLRDIQYVDRFRLKFEVYRDNKTKYKTHESPWYYPRGDLWKENYNSYKLGKMPEGDHEVRVYIRINDDNYRRIYVKDFEVDRDYLDDYYDDAVDYHYDYTYVGSRVDQIGPYDYRMADPGSHFDEDDYIRVMTRLSDMRYVDKFRVKHVLYKDDRSISTKEGAWQYPRRNWWQFNYTISDFGRLLKDDDYEVKTYVRINDKAYKYVGSREFSIDDDYYNYNYSYNYNSGYNYNSNYNQTYNYNYQPSYPYGYNNTYYPIGWSDPGGQYMY
jgi:hypothetical protein